jgi:hypothetical protein
VNKNLRPFLIVTLNIIKMKKLSLLFFIQTIVCCNLFAQNPNPAAPAAGAPAPAAAPAATPPTCSMNTYKGSYIFNANIKLGTCDAVGGNISAAPTIVIYQGSVFVVSGLTATCQLIIKFLPFKPLPKRLTYNIVQSNRPQAQVQIQSPTLTAEQSTLAKAPITDDNTQYFLLNQSDFAGICSPFTPKSIFSITLGTFTTPFKFRPTKSIFTNSLSLGAAAYFNWAIGTNNSIGFVAGISATSVTLDSLSTKGTIRTDTERPALTPSLSFVYTYKMINFTLGTGIDYVNKTSVVERSWIFNGKPWIGFGIGISLFSASSPAGSTTQDPAQK